MLSSQQKAIPAILGGKAALRGTLPCWPQSTPDDKKSLFDVLDSGQWWSKGGTQVSRFEKRFAQYHQALEGVACANGTQALELAFRALGIEPGDEVIVPAMTFVSTSMAVMLVGARPVPVDVEPGTWCLDANAFRRAITSSTRAVVPVHFAGQICDMDRIGTVAKEFDLYIIEDAAHAHGARWKGRSPGSFGDTAAFSFQNFKLMPAGEGGILITNETDLARKVRVMSNCGRPDGDRNYRHELLGTNSRMTEFQGAILNGQLDRLDELAKRRAKHGEILRRLLANQNYVRLQEADIHTDRHAWYMAVLECNLDAFGPLGRDEIVQALIAEGLPAYRMYPTVQSTPHFVADYRKLGGNEGTLQPCPVSERLAEAGIWFHHKLLLGDEDILVQTVEAIEKVASNSSALAKHFADNKAKQA